MTDERLRRIVADMDKAITQLTGILAETATLRALISAVIDDHLLQATPTPKEEKRVATGRNGDTHEINCDYMVAARRGRWGATANCTCGFWENP